MWYKEWFANHYYDVIYKHRDDKEAELFCNNIIKFIKLNNKLILDLCCGNGRLLKYLQNFTSNLVGLDITERFLKNIIANTNNFDLDKIQLVRADIAYLPFLPDSFDIIFNFFTSFGYFSKKEENNLVISKIYDILKQNGYFVFDYFNFSVEKENIFNTPKQQFDDILINKYIDGEHIVKQILIKKQKYEERVCIYKADELVRLFENNKFKIDYMFGDYSLESFDEKLSKRIIIVAKK